MHPRTPALATLSLPDALPISADVEAVVLVHRLKQSVQLRIQPLASGVALDPADGGAARLANLPVAQRSEEHTSELQSRQYLVCRLLLEKKKLNTNKYNTTDRT